ncbi:DUF4189 domain-containing protein [Pseudomonas viridiflava]|uniref:DUF4189 domain-containing protein n=1 Tax=Pseudomonas viridiflava TaxID=33069 RepID=UPI001C317316|nr:DUF4189 domain-containing protein [Pseudomonas viridiflava]QXG50010.1 DUF4189 domain-containing protein [Pseudomonas viridiflava]
MIRPALALILLIFSTAAFTQTRCPVGAQAGSVQCMPDEPATGTTPPPRPTGEWIKTWGAIATSELGNTGVSTGYVEKDAAEASAVSSCEKLGKEKCQVSLTFFNQCVAAAMSDSGKGTASTSDTLEKASSLTKERCESLYGGQCRITLSACTDAVFNKF